MANPSQEFVEYLEGLIEEKKQEGQWLRGDYERRFDRSTGFPLDADGFYSVSVYSRRMRRPFSASFSRPSEWQKLTASAAVTAKTPSVRPRSTHEPRKTKDVSIDHEEKIVATKDKVSAIAPDSSGLNLDDPMEARLFFLQLRELAASDGPQPNQDELLDKQLAEEVRVAVKNINFKKDEAKKPKAKKGPTIEELKRAADEAKVNEVVPL